MQSDPTTTNRAIIRTATKIAADESKFNRAGAPVKREGRTGEVLEIQPGQLTRVERKARP